MLSIKQTTILTATLAFTALIPQRVVLAACNSTVNGRPMTVQECNTAIQVYGNVVPGHYYADNNGNWVNLNNPSHRGNTYRDARRQRGGSWGGGSYTSPSAVYDASGGCEGGSCVNIID